MKAHMKGNRKSKNIQKQKNIIVIVYCCYYCMHIERRDYHIVCCVCWTIFSLCISWTCSVWGSCSANSTSCATVVIQGPSLHVCKGLAPLIFLVCISIANFNTLKLRLASALWWQRIISCFQVWVRYLRVRITSVEESTLLLSTDEEEHRGRHS